MALVSNNAEGGTNGTVVTTANSGGASGTAFGAVTAGIATFNNAQVAHGSLAYAITVANGSSGSLALSDGAVTSTDFSANFYVRFTAAPSATHLFAGVTNAARNAYVIAMQLTTSNTLELLGSVGFIGTVPGSSVTYNTWYRISIRGTTGATGSLYVTVHNGDIAAPLWSYTAASRDMGVNQAAYLVIGKVSATPNIQTFYADDIRLNIGSSADLGPIVQVSDMDANAGPDMAVEPGATGWLMTRGRNTATATYVKTGTWTQVSGTPVTLNPVVSSDGVSLASFVAPKAQTTQTLVFRLTMTDANSLSDYDEITVTVPPWQDWSWTGTQFTANQ
jgi:hypothetical protein